MKEIDAELRMVCKLQKYKQLNNRPLWNTYTSVIWSYVHSLFKHHPYASINVKIIYIA